MQPVRSNAKKTFADIGLHGMTGCMIYPMGQTLQPLHVDSSYMIGGVEVELPKRKNIRLKGYDYSSPGAYFITICTKDRLHLFGEIENGNMILNQYGEVVGDCIDKIALLHNDIEIKSKVIMPNHIHFILDIIPIVGVAYHATCSVEGMSMQEKSKMTLSKVIAQFKTATLKISADIRLHDMEPLQWQRNYYDHIIRNEQEYFKIWEYIDTNTLKWEQDCLYAK